jgi:hypothetical protein
MRSHWLLAPAVRLVRHTPQERLPSVPALMFFALAWGNLGYGGTVRLLRHVCRLVKRCAGRPILECGSGASTVLAGILGERYRCRLVSLEHDPGWADHVDGVLRRFRVTRADLHLAPLRSYGDFSWYTYPDVVREETFAAVVCDGPPAATRGGRFGLLPVAGPSLSPDCVVLLDDTHRYGERQVIARWRRLQAFETQSFLGLTGFTEIRFT